MTFSIVVPSWKDYKYLELFLNSLLQNTTVKYEVLLHLNEVDDQILDLARRYDLGCTFSEKNEGIAFGTNRCLERATGDYVFFPNSDMVMLPGWDIALQKAIEKFGENVYCSTMIEPAGANPHFIIKDYGREPEDFDLVRILEDLPSYRKEQYSTCAIVPYLIPRDLVSPMDERMWPGWVTDDDMIVSAYTNNPDTKFIRVGDSLIYHFMCKCTHRIADEATRWNIGMKAKEIFNNKWGRVYPGMNFNNYREMILRRTAECL